MFTSIKRPRIAAALASAGLLALPDAPVARDQAPAIEEIIVTAQRREQSLQDVSMSLSAFSGAALNERLIEEMQDLQFSVPNLLADARVIMIRGVGNNSTSSTSEAGLGFHINGVYVNLPLTRNSEYFDLQRIEVLRGPQGTLYGRNTTAGVINVITARPTPEFDARVTASVGNYSALRFKGMVNIPISDNIQQRFAGFYHERDGFTHNLYTGNDIDGRNIYELRGSTRFIFSENTDANLVINYQQEDSNRSFETKGTCTKDPDTGCSALSAGFETPNVSRSIFQTLNRVFLGGALFPAGDYFANASNPADFRTVNLDQEPTFETEQLGISLEISHRLDEYTLTSLSGYYDTEIDRFQDFDRFATSVRLTTPITFRANARDVSTTDIIQSGRRDLNKGEQFSQEFRLASQFDGDFNFLLGLYYYQQKRRRAVLITHPALAATARARGLAEEFEWFNVESNPFTTESYAFFGEAYYNISEKFKFTGGLRLTSDQKNIRTRQQFLTLVKPDWVRAEYRWEEATGKATLEYLVSDDSMVFVTAARGYKAGGPNPGGPEGGTLFKPEYINQVEIGAKNTWVDGRLQANFGAFYYDYAGLQIGQVSETSSVTTNADATVLGGEGEFRFLVTDNFEMDFNASWLDVELDAFTSADQGDPRGIAPGTVPALDANGKPRFTTNRLLIKNLRGNTLRNAPEFSFKLGLQYSTDILEGYRLSGRVDYFWQDKYFANEFNKPSDLIGAWEQADLQLTLTAPARNWYLKAIARNIFDRNDVTRRGQDGPLVGRFRSVNTLEPRAYALELQYNF